MYKICVRVEIKTEMQLFFVQIEQKFFFKCGWMEINSNLIMYVYFRILSNTQI